MRLLKCPNENLQDYSRTHLVSSSLDEQHSSEETGFQSQVPILLGQ